MSADCFLPQLPGQTLALLQQFTASPLVSQGPNLPQGRAFCDSGSEAEWKAGSHGYLCVPRSAASGSVHTSASPCSLHQDLGDVIIFHLRLRFPGHSSVYSCAYPDPVWPLCLLSTACVGPKFSQGLYLEACRTEKSLTRV